MLKYKWHEEDVETINLYQNNHPLRLINLLNLHPSILPN